MTDMEQSLVRVLEASNFASDSGLRLVSAGNGACIVSVPLLEKSERPGGIMAGYVTLAAADVASWLAIKTLLGVEDTSGRATST
jgi:acyl-coenzyme A thioesterase PaaI-like protein